ncbi:CRISPR-associated protein Cas4 [Pelistega sp. NLN82]|uniref:CRISPR-associated exonuclease Cas4 n=1 Tax=Pelistega ratti TaxID=2652177 RepID=A0A6L9Y3E4_9BURK|nr:CRISPR-associated protein Cas4 [Pelistega ratti]NEN74919.1 CRISPR-associated protein Cas4 [Pelistega ratti]
MIIPLSALQHYAFCPRQCALIHLEQLWEENFLTAQGRLLHERVDSAELEVRKGIRFERSVHVLSEKLGIGGVLDLVECELSTGLLKPVEYKRGKPKPEPFDEIQLCAQALCLEEMRGTVIEEGALWYMQTRHRVSVIFSETLRQKTLTVIHQVRKLLSGNKTPQPEYSKRCKACSLIEVCQPQLLVKDKSKKYVMSLFD